MTTTTRRHNDGGSNVSAGAGAGAGDTPPYVRAHDLDHDLDQLGRARIALERLSAQDFSDHAHVLPAAANVCGEVHSGSMAALYVIARDAVASGQVGRSQSASVHQWLRAAAPSLSPEDAGSIARAVRELAKAGREDFERAAAIGNLSVRAAMACAREWEELQERISDEAAATVREELIRVAGHDGINDALKLRPRLLAEHGSGADLSDDQDRLKPFVSLSPGRRDEQGLVSYRLVTDPEGHAVVEAAISFLSRAIPQEDGSADERSPERRRAEALIEALRRGSSPAPAPGSVGATKSTVVVTIDLHDLQAGTGGGTVVGSLATGTVLGADTIAKLACQGVLIPTILGSHGEPLFLGRATRFFTPAQVKALWVRDGGCTFPDCRAPAAWCDAHHVAPWSQGGPTDLDNGTLLCGRHHTIVHRDRLIGQVRDGEVRWDVTPRRSPGASSDSSESPEGADMPNPSTHRH